MNTPPLRNFAGDLPRESKASVTTITYTDQYGRSQVGTVETNDRGEYVLNVPVRAVSAVTFTLRSWR